MFVLYWGGGNDAADDVAKMEDRFYNASLEVIFFIVAVTLKHGLFETDLFLMVLMWFIIII